MAASVEVRVPFLEKNIVSSYFSDIDIVNKKTQKTRIKSNKYFNFDETKLMNLTLLVILIEFIR